MFQLNNGLALFERDEVLQAGFVDFSDVDSTRIANGILAQELADSTPAVMENDFNVSISL